VKTYWDRPCGGLVQNFAWLVVALKAGPDASETFKCNLELVERRAIPKKNRHNFGGE